MAAKSRATPRSAGSCPLCRSGDTSLLKAVDDQYSLARCLDCDFLYTSPRPDFAELERFYNLHDDYNRDTPPLSPAAARRKAAGYRAIISRHHPAARRVLEIGCLHGDMLFGLKQWGYEVTGADINTAARDYARHHYDIEVVPGERPGGERAETFDVLILSHVIEHLIDPVDFLRQAGRMLAPGGIILVEAPGADCILFDIFGPHYNMVRPPEHINFPTVATAPRLLGESGFTDVEAFTVNPLWRQQNLYFYGLLSLARSMGLSQRLRRSRNPEGGHETASSMRIPGGSPMAMALSAADLATRLLCLLTWPLLRHLARRNKGLILFAIARKA